MPTQSISDKLPIEQRISELEDRLDGARQQWAEAVCDLISLVCNSTVSDPGFAQRALKSLNNVGIHLMR